MGLTLGIALKFYTSVAKGLKLKIRTFWWLILTFEEITGKKPVGEPSCLPPSWIGLKFSAKNIQYSVFVWLKKYRKFKMLCNNFGETTLWEISQIRFAFWELKSLLVFLSINLVIKKQLQLHHLILLWTTKTILITLAGKKASAITDISIFPPSKYKFKL